jgi:hypothetical protein
MDQKQMIMGGMGLGGLLLLISAFTTSWHTSKVDIGEGELSVSVGLKKTKGCMKGECITKGNKAMFLLIFKEAGASEKEALEFVNSDAKTWFTYGNLTFFLAIIAGLLLLVGAWSAYSGKVINAPVAPERIGTLLAGITLITAILFATQVPGDGSGMSLGFSAYAGILGAAMGAAGGYMAGKQAPAAAEATSAPPPPAADA